MTFLSLPFAYHGWLLLSLKFCPNWFIVTFVKTPLSLCLQPLVLFRDIFIKTSSISVVQSNCNRSLIFSVLWILFKLKVTDLVNHESVMIFIISLIVNLSYRLFFYLTQTSWSIWEWCGLYSCNADLCENGVCCTLAMLIYMRMVWIVRPQCWLY